MTDAPAGAYTDAGGVTVQPGQSFTFSRTWGPGTVAPTFMLGVSAILQNPVTGGNLTYSSSWR
jgi:hypothetical protein